jgi:hypothetical protein
VGSERGKKGETKRGHTHLPRKTTTKGSVVQISELGETGVAWDNGYVGHHCF